MHIPLHSGCNMSLTISPDELHTFSVDMQRAEVGNLRIYQGPVDLAVEVRGPDDLKIAEVDGYEYGPEIVCWSAPTSGTYRAIVCSKSQVVSPAPYQIS